MKSRSDIQPNAVGAKPIAREPTEQMLFDGYKAGNRYTPVVELRAIFRAMWDAAPSPEGVGLLPWPCANCPDTAHCYRTNVCLNAVLYSAVGQEGPSEPEGGG